jgi:hypothetical protein
MQILYDMEDDLDHDADNDDVDDGDVEMAV